MAVKTLLILEDNPGDVELIKYYFKDTEYNLVLSESLKEIDLILKSQTVECIISDLNIRESSGLRTLNHLIEIADNTPVIVLTGIRDPILEKQALNSGAFEYLSKDSLNSLLLLRTVKSIYSHKSY